ncbi:InlB B-repeat-containing protein [Bifidobacterium amazonense]|uniref:InlB B-repeat-containing protein n=1 Tax=Bifidobacterium amazonense TaxID=2809027 RepID=A0ABS9VTN5_9BIFI|nr:InlB B-repeat-containing protein [Bifidobacterium amazonense]MCH9275439.1 InlB B-repeat-containing protein [Bifidobacterium amazonense]
MTGNNKVWRAPLAGLASVAMLATMGVAAGTANAAPSTAAEDQATVTFKGSGSVTGYKGETLADIVNAYGYDDETWTLDGKTPADWNTVIKEDTTLSVLKSYNYADTVTESGRSVVSFDLTDLAKYEQLPGGEYFQVQQGTKELSKNVLPVDKGGDHQLVTSYLVTPTKGKAFTVSTLSDPKFLAVAAGDPGDQVKVTVAAVAGKDAVRTVTVKGDSAGYVTGAKSDGTSDQDLVVDVANGSKFTIPAWFSYPQNDDTTQAETSPVWTRDRDDSGKEYKPGDSITLGVNEDRTFSLKSTSKAYTVRFYNDGALYDSQEVASGSYAKLPANPTVAGYAFKGWLAVADSGSNATVDAFNAYVGSEKYVTKGNDAINNVAITNNVRFVAVYGNKTTQVKVTFQDASYNGKHDDVVKYFDAGSTLNSSDAPAWTRSGYTLVGWTLNGKAYSFGQLFTDTTEDFVLTAVWSQYTADTVTSAFKYIEVNDANAERFEASSWAEYKSTYKKIQDEYVAAKYAAPASGITSETASKLVKELATAWQKLVFKHETNANVLGGATVHRLYKAGEHFYTSDANEIAVLTSTTSTKGGWSDEGRLFEAPAVEKNEDLQEFTEFPGTTAVKAQIAAISDPIVTPVYRLYNKVNGDHVWSSDDNEKTSLSKKADWNYEGIAFFTPTYTGTVTVSRLHKDSRHLLSTDRNEQSALSKKYGWKNEGTAFLGY